MGFQYAGNLGGAGAPVVMNMYTGETMYAGQLLGHDTSAANGGLVIPANAASEADEDDQALIGTCSGIVDDSRTYVAASSGTAQYGDRTTYTTTQATVLANGASEVQVTLIVPGVTLVKAPIYNAAWGTALTEMTVTTASSGGVTVTAASDAVAHNAAMEDFSTLYCRSGANRGLYRIVTTSTSTTVKTVVVPFPNAIAVGDVFVNCSLKEGFAHIDIPATADCIDGNNVLTSWYNVFVKTLNLEESGKEWAEFTFWGRQHVHT